MLTLPEGSDLQPPSASDARRLRARLDDREVAAAMLVLVRLLRRGAEQLADDEEQKSATPAGRDYRTARAARHRG